MYFWRAVRAWCGIVAAVNLVHLVAILFRLQTSEDFTAAAFLRSLIVIAISTVAFFWLRPKINRYYKIDHKTDVRILPKLWSI
jgi:hypothetical protein